jgi:oxygen-independent coproporphyrinogen-3 oxidase
MGAQSFHVTHLKTLERWHDPDNVARAIEIVAGAGITRRSVDIIYAIPGQTIADLERDLDTAASLPVEHVSAYNLTYEPNTAMTHRLNRGEFQPAGEDLEADMFTLVGERLRARGLERYEVSNYARPGAECRHNLAYWRQEQWLACGPSASGHARGIRWKNTPRLDDYLSLSDDGWAPTSEIEPRDTLRAVRERIMTGLRLREGVPQGWLLACARSLGAEVESRVERALAHMEERGLLTTREPAIVLSDSGILLADALAARLMKVFL